MEVQHLVSKTKTVSWSHGTVKKVDEKGEKRRLFLKQGDGQKSPK